MMDRSGNRGSRRDFLRTSGSALAGLMMAAHWPALRAAAHDAEHAARLPADEAYVFFDPAERADVDAIAAQIVPSDGSPGAREAHAVYFMDRILAGPFAALAGEFRHGLQDFQSACRAAHAQPFAGLTTAEQIGFLKTVDGTPFFETVRTLTLLGMFSSPRYGGNAAFAGWRLMGFEDRHVFEPPFGYYDRDYPGFAPGGGTA